MLDPEILAKFRKGITIEDVSRSSIAKRLIEDAITESVTGSIPEDCKYDYLQIAYDRGYYIVLGNLKNNVGGHQIQFKEDLSELGFRVDNKGVNYFSAVESIKELLKACVENIKHQARSIEGTICSTYLATAPDGARYGTEEYLEEEFAGFVKEYCDKISEGNNRHISEAFPLDFNLNGNILEYFKQHEIELNDKLHVILSKSQPSGE